jgi:Zn finger protein HypA/HybF involved in hydrogenase expression
LFSAVKQIRGSHNDMKALKKEYTYRNKESELMENANTVVTVSCRDCNRGAFIENVEEMHVRFCIQCGSKNISILKGGIKYG